MSLLVRFFAFVTLLFSFWAHAQTFEFKLEGSFITADQTSTGNPVTVNYTLKWNESSNLLQGIYQDNYYANSGPVLVTGPINTQGRTFNIILSDVTNGIKSITIKTTLTGSTTGDIPVRVVTQNDIGSTKDNVTTFALMSVLTNGPASNSNCSLGFGALAGDCGIYGGTFYEVSDPNNRCNLLAGGSPRIELGTDTIFTLYLNYINTTEGIPFHELGTFVGSPVQGTILLSHRNCGQLPGTNFSSTSCQKLSLYGTFVDSGRNKNFTGNYSIIDENSNDTCIYNFNLVREVTY